VYVCAVSYCIQFAYGCEEANIDLPKKTLVVFRTVFNKHIIVKFAYNYDKCIKIEFDKLTR